MGTAFANAGIAPSKIIVPCSFLILAGLRIRCLLATAITEMVAERFAIATSQSIIQMPVRFRIAHFRVNLLRLVGPKFSILCTLSHGPVQGISEDLPAARSAEAEGRLANAALTVTEN